MPETGGFDEALKAIEPGRLRAAFEATSRADERGGYDRTTLNRWLNGALPTREDFVRALSEQLDAPDLLAAWESARGTRSVGTGKSVASRFASLDPAEKDDTFHQIRRDYVSAGKPVRADLTYRIEVRDPPQDEADYLVLRIDVTWNGQLPAQAAAVLVTSEGDLGNAYDRPECLFRELVDFDNLGDRLDAWTDEQVLAYNPLGAPNPRPVAHRARFDSNGVAQFDNEQVDRAQVTLSLSYLVPMGTPMFAVKFGDYAIPGPATAELHLYSRATSRPRAMAYLAPGRQREWASNQLRANELFITLGADGTMLGEGDGVVLSWMVS